LSSELDIDEETQRIIREEWEKTSLDKLAKKTNLTQGQLYYIAYARLGLPPKARGSTSRDIATVYSDGSLYVGKAILGQLGITKKDDGRKFRVWIVDKVKKVLKLVPLETETSSTVTSS